MTINDSTLQRSLEFKIDVQQCVGIDFNFHLLGLKLLSWCNQLPKSLTYVDLRHFSDASGSKVDTNPLKTTPVIPDCPPLTVTSPWYVKDIICAKKHQTIREFEEDTVKQKGICHKILTEDLQRLVSAKFVPPLLTVQQKVNYMSIWTDMH